MFCSKYVYVEDKESGGKVLLELYDCQKRVATMLVKKDWLWILKARRLGLTWLLAAYSVWLVTFHPNKTVIVLNQSKEYAHDFIDRCRFIEEFLPEDFKQKHGKDNLNRIEFKATRGVIRAAAATERSVRSVSGDLVVFDEGAYFKPKMLAKARGAAQPAVEIGKGQIVCISTSAGPQGDYFTAWQDAASLKSKYKPVFLHWKEHPKRNEAWYENEKKQNEADPLYMKREYPATAEEAFEYAEGRIYPLFLRSDKFIHARQVHSHWKHYRGIDFGGVDAFVCLWACEIPGDGAGLTIDPSCENLVREMLAYSYDEHGKPKDENNHACDALRYLITTPGQNGVVGHLHIYRELYVPNSAARGYSLSDLAEAIRNASMGQAFECSVADRSRPDSILQLRRLQIEPIRGQRPMRSDRIGEIAQGIIHVNALVVGTSKYGTEYAGLADPKPAATNAIKGFF